MRISDWSSDVCSSDRLSPGVGGSTFTLYWSSCAGWPLPRAAAAIRSSSEPGRFDASLMSCPDLRRFGPDPGHPGGAPPGRPDRKRLVEGKSVSDRVDFGVPRFTKKKINPTTTH